MFGCCRSALVAMALLPLCCEPQSQSPQGEWFSTGQVIRDSTLPSAPPANPHRYSVSGTVVNSITGEPVRRAVVRIQGLETHVTFTGEDGRFQLDGVPEGVYSPMANRPGFQFKGGNMVTVGLATEPVTLKLDPQCSIQGHIIDENGEPLENIFVHLTQFQIANGRKREFGGVGANTDDNGDYEIDSIPPGKYIVATNQSPIRSIVARQTHVQQVYPAHFFPDAADEGSAQVMTLKGGEVLRADFKLSPVPAFHVSGTAGSVHGYPNIAIEDANGHQTGWGGGFNGRGMWNVLVPSGSWTVVLSERDQPGYVSVARVPVNVANADISGLQAVLQPVPSIPVHITAENNSDQPPSTQVKLVSHDSNATEFYARYDARDQSAPFSVVGIEPGTYSVYVTANGGNSCVESVQSGSADLSRSDLVISPGSGAAPIEIAERDDCASITLSAPSERTSRSYNVILTSDAPAFEPRLYAIQAGQKFMVNGLTPGDYKVYTVDDAIDLEYANPEALRNLSAQDIELGPNEKAEFAVAAGETAQVN